MTQCWIFSIITPVFSVTWSFRNHSNILIYYACWNILYFGTCDTFFFDSLMNTKLKRAAFVQNINIFQQYKSLWPFYSSLLNKSINFLKKRKKKCTELTPNFLIALYIVTQHLFFNQSIQKKVSHSQSQKSQSTLLNNQQIVMISEGSCDNEEWSNDAENSALESQKYIIF